jgi:S-adenosylmethionine:tRNA ribosyltransferase-isomerase
MAHIPKVDIEAHSYLLPAGRIAQNPLEARDMSKILVYKNGIIREALFKDLPVFIPEKSHLIYNQTRVVHARLFFRKETGSVIEIFCLEPVSPMRELQQAFECRPPVVWKCLVGHSKQWKKGKLWMEFNFNGLPGNLIAERIEKNSDHSVIRFSWEPSSLIFSEILNHLGVVPLPPYIDRSAGDQDKTRYQTIFAKDEGSVAAPTAGLHFTETVFKQLESKGIVRSHVTLHVGAGTFRPIQTVDICSHEMHTENIIIPRITVESILRNRDYPCLAVGTTTLRTIESLYWHGVKLLTNMPADPTINIMQWDPYELKYGKNISLERSLEAVLRAMDTSRMEEITGHTQLMIVPGYKFYVADVLVTNFHLPRSTLLLLISAFAGQGWKDVYQYALDHEFRFLSYGDSCLFFKA